MREAKINQQRGYEMKGYEFKFYNYCTNTFKLHEIDEEFAARCAGGGEVRYMKLEAQATRMSSPCKRGKLLCICRKTTTAPGG